MKQLLRLTIFGFLSGLILLIFLKIIQILTGNDAYNLLSNFDYIPYLNTLRPEWLFGYLFHFLTSILSLVVLFYFLKIFRLQSQGFIYITVFSLGGAALFFLTALSPQPPAYDDVVAWIYWTLGHFIFGLINAILIRKYSAGSFKSQGLSA